MKRLSLAIAVAFFAGVSFPAHAQKSPEELLKRIVQIRALIPEEASTAGSLGTERVGNGIIIDAEGHILTIGYLIVEAESIEVLGPEGKMVHGSFVAYDTVTGFGLLRTETPFDVEPIKLGQSSEAKEGDRALIAAYGGVEWVQGVRIIARKELALPWENLLDRAILTSPPYNDYGGAALIGRDGRLLGIGYLFSQMGIEGLGLVACNVFIPIDLLPPILENLLSKGHSGKPARPWLGIYAEEVQGQVFITRVRKEGPGEKSGLEKGDQILEVGEKKVKGLADFYRKVWALGNAGVEVPLKIQRGEEMREMRVRSTERTRFLNLKAKKRL